MREVVTITVEDVMNHPHTDPPSQVILGYYKARPVPVIEVGFNGRNITERQVGVTDRINVTLDLPSRVTVRPGQKLKVFVV